MIQAPETVPWLRAKHRTGCFHESVSRRPPTRHPTAPYKLYRSTDTHPSCPTALRPLSARSAMGLLHACLGLLLACLALSASARSIEEPARGLKAQFVSGACTCRPRSCFQWRHGSWQLANCSHLMQLCGSWRACQRQCGRCKLRSAANPLAALLAPPPPSPPLAPHPPSPPASLPPSPAAASPSQHG